MTKKRILRFIIRYFIGLCSIMLIVSLSLYFYFTKMNQIDSEIDLPQTQLLNQFGELKSFSDFQGKILLVDFWFMGCKPCLEEMKLFPELLKKYNSDLAIMSISVDPEEITEMILLEKPQPWDFIISENKNWTFYNVDAKTDNSLIKKIGVVQYPTYLLFNRKGELISSPKSGIAAVENNLSGFFNLDITYKTHQFKEIKDKLPALIIPYTLFVIFILLIQLSIVGVKKLIRRNKH